MMTFYDLPDSLRGGVCTCFFLIFTMGCWNLLLSIRQRRRFTMMISGFLMVISYPVLQVIGDILYWNEGNEGSEISLIFGRIHAAVWILMTIGLLSVGILMTVSLMKWNREHLTPMSVRDGMDKLKAGLCYWEDGGKLVLSNRRMDEICETVTGEALLSGERFYDAISGQESLQMPDGTVQRFTHQRVPFGGRQIHELVATDVTELQKKNEMLISETAALRKMNENLRRYNQGIEEMVRRQEILDAKAYVHDEMNRLMLVTTALTEGEESQEEYIRVLTLWRNNATLLSSDAATKRAEAGRQDLRQLARLLGVKLFGESDLPEDLSEEARETFMMAIREAMANAVKHGAAKTVTVEWHCEEGAAEVRISNDGRLPEGEIREGGGTSNIRQRAEACGGTLQFETSDVFCMILRIPLGEIR